MAKITDGFFVLGSFHWKVSDLLQNWTREELSDEMPLVITSLLCVLFSELFFFCYSSRIVPNRILIGFM